ncbi:hypothetical protein OV203_17925 [Nannocystis sp. ILAH1]|uniref:hypothetical protein n=1 Tax=Nannocystis sp. ILAH1 TaxID=2996789 RepID=UPI002270EA33|nr:hypothetical protein [Nannocystis sp. ILAH1]MCY0989020.1 hypothetical protein [Nannocystis sp. ILAH1]
MLRQFHRGYCRYDRQLVAPIFDRPDCFRADRIRLGDIDGSGTTDLVYVRQDGARVWHNDLPQKFETRTTLDIEGNTLEVRDARNNVAETNTFAPGGLQLKTHSVDAGARLALPNVLGNPLRAWDNRPCNLAA